MSVIFSFTLLLTFKNITGELLSFLVIKSLLVCVWKMVPVSDQYGAEYLIDYEMF